MLFVIPFVPLMSREHDLKPLTTEVKQGILCKHYLYVILYMKYHCQVL
jgi:hypothetical protein